MALARDEFIAYLERGEIPPEPPEGTSKRGWELSPDTPFDTMELARWFNARSKATAMGMWAIVDQRWTAQLAEWLAGRLALEVMAGAGWLAKALTDHGARVIATDSYEWDGGTHTNMRRVFPVKQADAVEAIEAYPEADVLIVSWPPYGEGAVVDAMRAWGSDRPVVYIGEQQGGCNAPDEFFSHFWQRNDAPEFDMMAWDGMHDDVHIGYWREERNDD